MAKLTITGNTKPIVGNTEMYSLSAFDNLMTSNALLSLSPKIQWNLHVQDKKGWRIAKGNTKEGEHITYKFTHKSLQYKSLKIVVTRGKDKGEFYIKPQEAEEPKITRVDILDINGQRLPKGKRLHYTETLIVKAHCVGMFGQKVSFTLWEDDAIGKGHDPVINMMNRINPMPLIGEVDHQGIARVVFRLPSYTMAVQIANAGLAKGDRSEGNTHEYYVTAELVSKHILVASLNVNVVNPTHLPDPAKKPKSDEVKPPVNSPHKEKINKPKPKEETAKFPQSPAAKKQTDPEGKILSAEFTDGTGKTLKNARTGDIVSIKMVTQNMKGKNVIVRIWEEDFSRYSNDLLYEKTVTLRYHTSNVINNVKLTRLMYTKSNEWGEGSEREYFIEVEHLNTSVTSQVIPVSADGEKAEVDGNDSVAVIKEIKEDKKGSKICECEARVRAYMRMLRVGEGTGELIKSSRYNKETRKSEIIYISHDFESGYTRLFGDGDFTKYPNNKDMSDHPNIKVLWYTKKNGVKVYSSAAGAYQIMGYTWYDKDMINKRKDHNIKDFSFEGQDKFCIILFKYKKAGMLDLIIEGKIKEATEKYGSYEWASLPPARYGQPIETMEKALELYNRFYQEELMNKSPLHLKKGFLKEFDYKCCEQKLMVESLKQSSCGKSEIDLRSKVKWQTQFDPKWGKYDKQVIACKKTCDDILINSGLKATSLARLYQTAIENKNHTKLNINIEVSQEAILYLDSELEKGHPVQIGVNHGLGYKIKNNIDGSTDHFVVIVGRKCEGSRCYYIFYDVGTNYKEKGASDNNRLYLDKTDYSLKGKTVYNGHFYTVTQIRKN